MHREDSGFAEGAALYDAYALSDGDKLTGGKCGVFLDKSEWPMDLNVGGCRSTEAEVQTGIAGGEITGLTEYLLGLHLAAVVSQDARPDGAAVALHSLKTDLDPVVAGRSVVAQQRRRLVDVHDQDIHIAVVVEVAKGNAAAAVAGNDTWTSLRTHFGEGAVTPIAKKDAGRAQRVPGRDAIQLRIDGAGRDEDVRVAVVVEVDQTCAEADVAGFVVKTGLSRPVVEVALAVVAINASGLIDKVGLDQV